MKKFSIDEYVPIDYRNWLLGDEARKGVNLRRSGALTSDELLLWESSLSYQDQRDDPGHAEMSTLLGIRLLDYLPGIREVVVPV